MADKKVSAPKIELPRPTQRVRVRSLTKDGYRRADVPHTRGGTDHAYDAFTPEQLEELHADKNIAISYIDAPKGETKKD